MKLDHGTARMWVAVIDSWLCVMLFLIHLHSASNCPPQRSVSYTALSQVSSMLRMCFSFFHSGIVDYEDNLHWDIFCTTIALSYLITPLAFLFTSCIPNCFVFLFPRLLLRQSRPIELERTFSRLNLPHPEAVNSHFWGCQFAEARQPCRTLLYWLYLHEENRAVGQGWARCRLTPHN